MAKQTRATRIADAIKRDIATGALRSGDFLPPERTMVARYRVSRVIVREAYCALQGSGITAVQRGRGGGTFIVEPGALPISESLTLALRLGNGCERQVEEARVVEPLVAALAARNATEAQVLRLQSQCSRPIRGNRGGTIESHTTRFRLEVAACAHNVALAAVVRSVTELSCTWSSSHDAVDGGADRVTAHHRLIYAAIAGQDEAAAAARMRDYLAWIQSQSPPSIAGAPRSVASSAVSGTAA